MDNTMVTRAEMDTLTNKVNGLEIRTALNENNIENLNRKLDKIDANITKLTWLVMAAVLGAVLKSVGLF